NSVLKLLRKLIIGDVLVTVIVLPTTVSLIPSWSGVNRSLGGLSGFTVDVTQPPAQPGGRAGAVTPSKFSTHGCDGVGLTGGVGVGPGGVGDGVPLGDGIGVPFPRSYASTRPTPVPSFFPASSAVY